MYIKSIVLDGFKSYGQRTEINGFDEQFNAITGLNGSGKSNILDSICFVLGISNLSHVRAGSLQDLIYKSGQAGINKATVSITFDNRNNAQCPPGFENYQEITITRQIVMGGKNKYMINGTNVPNKKVQDLFCSIQLNVNNPHFLIMQGRITKVLNMKPPEILAMVEEAAGTRMYEVKRQVAQKTIEKKDAKLLELQSIFNEEISPKLEKLREERAHYLEYQRVERELEHMMGLYQVWLYFESQRISLKAEQALEKEQNKIKAIEDNIEKNKEDVVEIERNVEEITKMKQGSEKLEELEGHLKENEKLEAKSNASLKSIKDNISSEEKKLKQLQKNMNDDSKALATKEQELNKVQSLFETLKQNDARDNEAFALSQKKYEALAAGMEVNEDGEAETLQEQLMNAKHSAAQAGTESKQASMKLSFCQQQLKEKQRELGANSSDYETDKANLNKMEREVKLLESNLLKLNFSEDRMSELMGRRRQLQHEIRNLRERVENFEAHKPQTNFHYRDPEQNFNRRSVNGVVCRLINCIDNTTCTALETAAGGRLYNVVVDSDVTSKKLLQRGQLQNRTTFIPLNKIQAHKMDQRTIKYAQDLVGKENCQPALSLIQYERHLQPAMEFIFGNVFICRDMNVARQITFNDKIRKKCVTLDGDVTDPSGTLSGGARQKGQSILMQLQEIKAHEEQLMIKEQELREIEAELSGLRRVEEQYSSMKRKLELNTHELNLVRQRLQQTTQHRQQEEVEQLKAEIVELQEKATKCREIEAKANKKATELETKMKDAKGYREKQLKEADLEMKKLKKKAEQSSNEWKKREQEYETLNLEISELKKGLENTEQQIKSTEETIVKLKEQFEEANSTTRELKEKVRELQDQVKAEKAAIAEKNKEIQKKLHQKEKLLAQNVELELEIKKHAHEIKKLQDDCKNSKSREHDLSKKVKKDNRYLTEAENMSAKEGLDLERRIKNSVERKHKLGRTVNTKAQSMFEHEEKQYNELKKKQSIVENDKRKLLLVMADLDQKKKNSLKLAYEQVSKDFGSIFSTLLPGANAKLVAPFGKTILEGLEVKVSLGGVWKESLTELSGGQRSLAALSLILAMLLFKPAPLYILDEVDAALDLSHTQNIGNMLKSHFKKSQFIIVSLKDGMFNNANVLYRTKFVDGVSTVQRTVNKS